MAKFLSQDQINEYKECFSLYDRRRGNRIECGDLITVMRCLGLSPTQTEIHRHLTCNNIAPDGTIDFSTFLSLMHRQRQQENPLSEVLTALKMADRQHTGFISASELRTKLTKIGEKLTDAEVDDLLKQAGVGTDGKVYCEKFAKAVTRAPTKP